MNINLPTSDPQWRPNHNRTFSQNKTKTSLKKEQRFRQNNFWTIVVEGRGNKAATKQRKKHHHISRYQEKLKKICTQ